MNVYVVNVSLRAIEEYALNVIKRLFNCATCKAGPVSRNLASSNNVRMVCVIDNYNALRALAVKAQEVFQTFSPLFLVT